MPLQNRRLYSAKPEKTCRPEVGLVFLELLTEMRKLLRHLSNITDRAGQLYVRPGNHSLPGDVTREVTLPAPVL